MQNTLREWSGSVRRCCLMGKEWGGWAFLIEDHVCCIDPICNRPWQYSVWFSRPAPHWKGQMSYRGKDSEYVVGCFRPPHWLHYRWRWGICHCRLEDRSWQLIIGSTYRDKGCHIPRKGFYRHAGNISEDRTQAVGG